MSAAKPYARQRSPPKRTNSATYGSRSRSPRRSGSKSAVKRAYMRRKASRDRSACSNCTFANLNDSGNWDDRAYNEMEDSMADSKDPRKMKGLYGEFCNMIK